MGCTSSAVAAERQVSSMLDRLYTKMDELAAEHCVTKIDTIGDACAPRPSLSPTLMSLPSNLMLPLSGMQAHGGPIRDGPA